ncbi:ABC transporter ATP-binding protein [Cohnella sp. LGH]|uniref:ABC transporter ATP-binding protein n=1 Tax=Cohnella sp. LGH TaxID=1619153 RepID=UPI001ADB135B|nr:ABC transporter ATP-binding protein [Cohnella sp. LGH]QTH40086.1 ABC transporter ATP-binding protein [Cohnella sp. LGH]
MSKLNRPAALRLHNLQVSYTQNGRPVPVLGKLSLALGQGEIVSLLGESGSGKSTIAKAMTGLLPPSAAIGGGELIVGDGAAVDLTANGVPWSKLRGRKIGLLFQDAQQALNPLLTVRAHFRESLRFHRLASSAKEADGIGVRLLAQLRFSDPTAMLDRYPFQLSGGMCQRVCLALSLCLKPDVLIADEPTSALDTVSQKEVLDLLRRVREEHGVAILLVTHDIAVANAVSDRIIVLNRGVIEEEGEARAVLSRPQAAYTRKLIASRSRIADAPRRSDEMPTASEPVLEIGRLDKSFHKRPVLRQLDLTLHRGDIVGILGQSGCGKSTLARCIAGLERPDGGRILYRGTDVVRLRGRARREICRRIQLVFQDARASLNPRRTAVQLVQEPLRYLRIGSRREREALARFYLNEAGIADELQERRPPQLSTGQCQRIAIARALILQPDVLICDEAVSALDMSVQAQILALLQRLHRQFGFAMIMISHDVRVLRSFCHSIAVMNEGSFCEVKPAEALHLESRQPYTRLLLQCAGELEAGLG